LWITCVSYLPSLPSGNWEIGLDDGENICFLGEIEPWDNKMLVQEEAFFVAD